MIELTDEQIRDILRGIDTGLYDGIRAVIAADRAMQAAEIERLRADADQMLETLTGIRNANPREWEELSCEFTEFERWAKARANHSILKNAAMKEAP